ncbi:hypothetical protein LJC10_05805, partial [Selenomonadales bacterium OttesenSCG-928-I06]|nr:hypothetical protein [Selenomonadales bacterium OttesenSCG-928-I06]
AWLVGWGERATCGIYPRNTYAGLKMRDLGEADVLDAEGNPFRAVQTLFNWNVGLTVRDIRSNAVLRNIKTTELDSSNLVEKMIIAKNRIRNLDLGSIKYVWYVPNCVYTALETHLINSSNIHVTRQDFMGAMPTLYLAGIPVRKVDAILENEARIG